MGKAKEAVKVRLSIFKQVASTAQLNEAVSNYIDYFYEDEPLEKVVLLDPELMSKEVQKKLKEERIKAERVKKDRVKTAKDNAIKDQASLEKSKKIEVGRYKFSLWHSTVRKDEFTDKIQSEAFTLGSKVYNDYASVGVRCMSGEVFLTFDAAKFIAFGGKNVDVKYRVDKNETEKLSASTYTNSNTSGYSNERIPKNLVLQMKAGNRILIEVANKRRSNVHQNSFSLKGFTSAYNKVWRNCQ